MRLGTVETNKSRLSRMIDRITPNVSIYDEAEHVDT